MKLRTKEKFLEFGGVAEVVDMTIKQSAKGFKALMSELYSNPIESIIREREVEIAQAKLEADILLQQAEGRRLAALKQQEIDLINTETQVLTQQKLADGFSPAWAMTKYLEFLQTAAANPSTIYLPMATLEQLPAQIGVWSDAMSRSGRSRP